MRILCHTDMQLASLESSSHLSAENTSWVIQPGRRNVNLDIVWVSGVQRVKIQNVFLYNKFRTNIVTMFYLYRGALITQCQNYNKMPLSWVSLFHHSQKPSVSSTLIQREHQWRVVLLSNYIYSCCFYRQDHRFSLCLSLICRGRSWRRSLWVQVWIYYHKEPILRIFSSHSVPTLFQLHVN